MVESLVTEVGPRLAGSEAEARARDWAVRMLRQRRMRSADMSPIEREKQEREANAFAMALLMPEELLRDALDDEIASRSDRNEDAILRSLARRFEVSETIMACRLVDLGMLIGP